MSQEHIGYPYEWQKFTEAELEAMRRHQWMVDKQGGLLERDDPWTNGRYALSALVWGLIIMLVVSVMA